MFLYHSFLFLATGIMAYYFYKENFYQELLGHSKLQNEQSLILEKRRSLMQQICHSEKYHTKIERDYLNIAKGKNVFEVVKGMKYQRGNNSFLWCDVPKVGSTSWVSLFQKHWFPAKRGGLHKIINVNWSVKRNIKCDEDCLIALSNKTFSFLITRHPFERMLSAYRFYFLFRSNDKLAKPILKKYRKKIPRDPIYKQRPTFKEFADSILDTKVTNLNGNWKPIYNRCMPCHINYDIIGRLDSIDFDSKEILKNIGLEDRFPKTNVINNKSSDMEIEEYFSQLDKETLDKLYKVYEMDFVLFNYTIDAFYPLVKNKTDYVMSN